MQIHTQNIKLIRTHKTKKIATEVVALHRTQFLEYIAAMASELSALAAKNDEKVLEHLLNLASLEAISGKDSKRWRAATG
jgi:hypothetical protein